MLSPETDPKLRLHTEASQLLQVCTNSFFGGSFVNCWKKNPHLPLPKIQKIEKKMEDKDKHISINIILNLSWLHDKLKNVIKQSNADNQNLGVTVPRLRWVNSPTFEKNGTNMSVLLRYPGTLPKKKNIVLYVSHLKTAIFSLRENLELTPAIFRLNVPRTYLARRFTWGVLCLTNIYQLITDMWIPSWQKMGATNFPGKMGSTINIRNIFKKLVAPQKLSWKYPWSSATWQICEKTKDGVSWEVIANSLTPYLTKERSVFFTVLFWSLRVTLKVENLHETLWGHYEIYSCSHTPCVRSLLYHWEPFKETYQQKLPWSTTMKVQKHVLQKKMPP